MGMSSPLIIVWFRRDLRLADNPALKAAAEEGRILPIYILDDENAGEHKMGGASRWFLHHSLEALNKDMNGHLSVYAGKADTIIPKLVKQTGAHGVYWNRCYEPWRIERDEKIKKTLLDSDIDAQSFNGSLLWEPWEVRKDDGTPYKVFTPFYRKGCLLNAQPPRKPYTKPEKIQWTGDKDNTTKITDLKLLPDIRWDKQMDEHWDISEDGAHERLEHFMDKLVNGYKEDRNHPGIDGTSRLSPYLHFGQLSPNQIWYAVKGNSQGADTYKSELGWREFSYNLLYHFPELPKKNLQTKFDPFPWRKSAKDLKAWQRGQTGVPIVDAGMRELWQTGYMHNRVRMIVASFLIKNLLVDWRSGEEWFWDCLADADLANNSAGWQWVAGSGADAAPYFRVFNPVMQGQKFDADGKYTRHYVPELANMPDKYLFNPWEAPDDVLKKAKVKLGDTYPKPIVDLQESRDRALSAFKSLKQDA